MTTEAESLTETEEEAMLELIVRNQLKMKELQDQNDALKSYYKQSTSAFPAGTRRTVGKFYVQISENTRMDDTLARQTLGASRYERITKKVLDVRKANASLSEAEKKKIRKVFDNKIEVGLQ